jgi:FtsP/CotA-like multicopper oxidase with cupredoxin domain
MRRTLFPFLLFAFASPPRRELPLAVANDNRLPSGTLTNGVLTLNLVATMARWYPEASDGPFADVPAFAEEGKAPSIPGPLVRVPVGTRIHLIVRNALPDSALSLIGYGVKRAGDTTAVLLAPGERRTFDFTATTAGTFMYAARSTRDTTVAETEQLAGAIVVDAPGARPDDRVLVLNIWTAMTPAKTARSALAINGKSWPHTERIAATVGDTLRWRVVNATLRPHPMHLHGAYFRVDARGDALGDTTYATAWRRMAVTELMEPRTTMRMTWSPETPGNWLFHCHLAFHVIASARLDAPQGGEHDMHSIDPAKHMAGLVVGINVRARRDPSARVNVRHVSVVVAPGVAKDTAHLRPIALKLSPSGRAPEAAGVRPRGDLILLTRGEPTDITVHNALAEPTGIHWHGLELESWSDGVVGFSGAGTRVAPPIAPNDSFVAHLTLKRAGTFIYHTHLNDLYQIASGLYGPLVVLKPGETWDPSRDLVLTAGFDITGKEEGPVVNGGESDPPLHMRVGRPVRMRFINIQPADPVVFEVVRDSLPAQWRPVAKDGYDLPRAQSVPGRAKRELWVGETFDAEFAPREPGTYLLRAWGDPKHVIYERRLEVTGPR